MSNTHPIASIISAAVFGSLVGFLLFAVTDEPFWIGMGASIAVTGWLAAGLSGNGQPRETRWEAGRDLVLGLSIAAGMGLGALIALATEEPFWIGIGLSLGIATGALLRWER